MTEAELEYLKKLEKKTYENEEIFRTIYWPANLTFKNCKISQSLFRGSELTFENCELNDCEIEYCVVHLQNTIIKDLRVDGKPFVKEEDSFSNTWVKPNKYMAEKK